MGDTVDVLVGTIGRAHGLRGEVSVHVRTDEPERRFVPGARLRVGGKPRTVASSRWHSGTLLLALEGGTDRTASLRHAERTNTSSAVSIARTVASGTWRAYQSVTNA